jgi:16S rRNA (cytosine967-C5)-methyltransferase
LAERGRSRASARPAAPDDPARRVAYDLLRAVAHDGAYANLTLPRLLDERRLAGRDSALATELGYGTVRAAGTLDEILGACVDRPLEQIEPAVLDLLRLGSYQLLRTRIPQHAAVATTVDLARSAGYGRAAGFVNAVLRRVSRQDWDGWTERLARGAGPVRRMALRSAHPEWIAAAFADALGGDLAEADAALAADDTRPQTHLVAWPGRIERADLVTQTGGAPGPYSPYAVRLAGGDPAAIAAIADGRAAVQDEGSQLCAIAVASTPIEGRDERWLDLCAGPGGKTALLAALAADRGAKVTATELHPHRGELVRRLTAAWDVDVQVADARTLAPVEGGWDRILVDAPCTGLGALRRRPEARWRRTADDVAELAGLQRQLFATAMRLVRPGGVVAYVTCSPHVAETEAIVAGSALIDARPSFPGVDQLGAGPTVQLWPHLHGTDAMFCAFVRG